MTEQDALNGLKTIKESMEVSCVFRASRTGDMKYPKELEALDIAISALEKQINRIEKKNEINSKDDKR